MNFRYMHLHGIYVILPGMTVMLPKHMTIGALQNHLRELHEYYG